MATPPTTADHDWVVTLLLRTDARLAALLNALAQEAPPKPFASNDDYTLFAELRFLVAGLHKQCLSSMRTAVVGGGRHTTGATMQQGTGVTPCAPADLAGRVDALQRLKRQLDVQSSTRLALTGWRPRAARVADAYALSPREADAMLFLQLLHIPATDLWSTIFEDMEEGTAELRLLRDVVGLSAIEAHAFAEEQRLHIKEGVVQVREDDFAPGKRSASLSIEAVEMLVFGVGGSGASGGAKAAAAAAARTEKLALKLSGTRLLRELQAEAGTSPTPLAAAAPPPPAGVDQAAGGAGGAGGAEPLEAAGGGDAVVSQLLRTLDGSVVEEEEGAAGDSAGNGAGNGAGGDEPGGDALSTQAAARGEASGAAEAVDVTRLLARLQGMGSGDVTGLEAEAEAEGMVLAGGAEGAYRPAEGEAATEEDAADEAPVRGYDSELEVRGPLLDLLHPPLPIERISHAWLPPRASPPILTDSPRPFGSFRPSWLLSPLLAPFAPFGSFRPLWLLSRAVPG